MTLTRADDPRTAPDDVVSGAKGSGRRGGLRRWLPPVLAVVVAIGVWWLVTGVLSAPNSLLRQTVPPKVVAAIGGLFDRGVLLPDAGSACGVY